jgi:hypothetical protein
MEQDKEWTQVKYKKYSKTSVFKRLYFPYPKLGKAGNSSAPVATVFNCINSDVPNGAANEVNQFIDPNNGSLTHAGISHKLKSD